MDPAIPSQLRNGYNRPRTSSSKQNWAHTVPTPVNYNTMQMVDPQHVMPMNMVTRKSTASDSGGSSTGETSPPPMQPDPAAGLHGNANQTQSSGSLRNKQPLNLSRLNGGKHGNNNNNNNNVDFSNGSGGSLVTSSSSGNLPVLIGAQIHNFPGYRTLPPQRQQFPTPPNGELMYSFTGPYLPTQGAIVVTSASQRASPSAVPVPTPYPTIKMVQSCFNCGSTNHTGLNCSEASMEDVTRNAMYKLDYTVVHAQPFTIPAAMTPSSSQASTSTIQPANNNEPDTSITYIDLTQDTSSSSSSSTSSIHGAK